MTPTLSGRIQTRLFLLLSVGALWTLIVTPVLPVALDPPLGEVYEVTFTALLIVILAGIAWEVVYHGLQQFRWEKDWPALFGLLVGVNEGLSTWIVLNASRADPVSAATFFWHFTTTWLVVWLFANGPMRVVILRWRYLGGRIRS